MFNPNTSLLAGMSTAALQQALQDAQQAYIDLSTGAKGESFSYTQGDGAKSVTYTRANIGQLQMLIRQLQQQLGIIPRARRAIRPIF
ncbi:gpW family protein [Chromobacterium rhizoryzae]|uniref:gpW family protein n=1 Tax=Chromobacterium rhizoryzae TaxID=1778675 RepID=UPI001D07C4DA|nr:gpW family protein [Chromobacterium rhizoryzae]